ncbi:unnamed protein product [Rotaria sp. Silwood1]|nr:unnamed protein product [Rotaria sp. Silwood1]
MSFISDFIQIEKLIFDHINSKYLDKILKYLIHLPKLHTFILSPFDYILNSTVIFTQVFRLKKLKYFLSISTFNDSSYSHAKQWEELISSSMPNLHIFDMNNSYTTAMHRFLYLCLSDQFRSKFWKEKQWFFDHQYDCHESSNNGIFYSINPYRRKDHTFHWQFDHDIDSYLKKHDFKSVKYINICVINLICLTPNLCFLKWNFQSIDQTKLKSIEQSENFRSLSNTNKIQNLQIPHCCSFDEIQTFINVFPQLESLHTGVFRKQIVQITRCLL